MSGSARSLQISSFSGLRVASCSYHPAHNKNGINISQRLVINAFMNIASRANDGAGRNDVISLTTWGKLADVCAKSMSPGKEFNCHGELHVYNGRVFDNDQMLIRADGTPVLSKKMSFTITRLTFGEESNKHIADEIQKGFRPVDWNQMGSAGNTAWRERLRARSAVQFDPNQPVFGFAKVVPATGPGISAYNPALNAQPGATVATGAPVVPLTTAVETTVVDAAGHPAAVATNLFPTGVATVKAAAVDTGFATPAGV